MATTPTPSAMLPACSSSAPVCPVIRVPCPRDVTHPNRTPISTTATCHIPMRRGHALLSSTSDCRVARPILPWLASQHQRRLRKIVRVAPATRGSQVHPHHLATVLIRSFPFHRTLAMRSNREEAPVLRSSIDLPPPTRHLSSKTSPPPIPPAPPHRDSPAKPACPARFAGSSRRTGPTHANGSVPLVPRRWTGN